MHRVMLPDVPSQAHPGVTMVCQLSGLAPCHEPTPERSTDAFWSRGDTLTSSTASQLMMAHDNIKIGLLDRKYNNLRASL